MKIDNFFGKENRNSQPDELDNRDFSEIYEIKEGDYQINSEFLFDQRLVALY